MQLALRDAGGRVQKRLLRNLDFIMRPTCPIRRICSNAILRLTCCRLDLLAGLDADAEAGELAGAVCPSGPDLDQFDHRLEVA